ncbi:MATE family efflux transporter [Vibrio sp. DW001]|uniref:MATE family efflux transporter n=1 Tax=Vibrio sp. DW001 TaxID=2912315 RepID=UPI0023AEA3A6|nr:MATE family efflux transporter [Vibrio sp. DW001]WED29817.1 MATE family efflux transporter [Vibrio sp. DW001]
MLRKIIDNTLPLTFGVLSIMLVQLIDSIFIGRLGIDALTAQGLTLPFHTVIIGIQVGLGVASTSIISQAVGSKNIEAATKTATIGVIIGVLVLSMLSLTLWLKRPFFLSLFGDFDNSASGLGVINALLDDYWSVWLISAVLGALLYFISGVYRANGETKTPGYFLILASMINLVLDPIFMFTFEMGIKGAALASSVSFAICILIMVIRVKKKQWFCFSLFERKTIDYSRALMNMAIPTTANQILPSVSAMTVTFFIAQLGTTSIAFWTLLTRLEMFSLVLALSLTMSIPPMVGRYIGEKNTDKVAELVFTAARFVLVYHIIIAIAAMLGASYISELLTEDTTLSSTLTYALVFVPLSYGPLGLCMVIVSVFNALCEPKKALILSSFRLFVFYIPATVIGVTLGSIESVLWGVFIANILAGTTAWFMFSQRVRKLNMESDYCENA